MTVCSLCGKGLDKPEFFWYVVDRFDKLGVKEDDPIPVFCDPIHMLEWVKQKMKISMIEIMLDYRKWEEGLLR
jgi:hypothetical protein